MAVLFLSQGINQKLKDSNVLLDTNVFICAARHEELLHKLFDLGSSGVAFATISSVVFEYTRGSQSLAELSARRQFVVGLTNKIKSVGNFLESEKLNAFSAAMSLVVKKGDSQYTDYLLAAALYQYMRTPERTYVLSGDVRAFPMTLFDIEGMISFDNIDGKIAHLYLVGLNEEKYRALTNRVDKMGQA